MGICNFIFRGESKLKSRIKSNIRFFIAIISIAVILGLIWIWLSSLKAPDKDKMEKIFKRDNADLIQIIEYLIDSDYSIISIKESDVQDKYNLF